MATSKLNTTPDYSTFDDWKNSATKDIGLSYQMPQTNASPKNWINQFKQINGLVHLPEIERDDQWQNWVRNSIFYSL
jgi:hypothetical protein